MSRKTTPIQRARRMFRRGTRVTIDTKVMPANWNDDDKLIAVDVIGFRDSDYDPIVCVCCASLAPTVLWFSAEYVRRLRRGK